MSDDFQVHECEHLPKSGVYIDFTDDVDNEEEHAWYLNIHREAEESDVMENHYLDEGDDIWSTMLEITHCPFCGEKLPDLDKVDKKSYGKFSHIDSSGWSSKMV